MKTIGRIAALVMTLSLALVLSACGGNASSSASASSGSAAAASASATASTAASSSASASAATSSAASTSAAAGASASASASAADAVDATSYTNEFFGLDCVLPEGWSFVDSNKLAQVNPAFAGIAGNSAVDMCAVSGDQSTAIILAVIEPAAENAGMTAESFLKAHGDEMRVSQQGVDITTEGADITFNGMSRTLPALFTTITSNGSSIVIGQAVAEKDGYFLDIAAMGANGEAVQDAFKAFKATAE